MVLVDTSVWVDFIRAGDSRLADLLLQNRVVMHDMVLGELACGNLRKRPDRLAAWRDLPRVDSATHDEVMPFLEGHQLFGLGIGYVDLHLLAATQLNPGTRLWTRDKRLNGVASRLGLAYVPPVPGRA